MGLQVRTAEERGGQAAAAPWKHYLLIFLLALAVRTAFVVWHQWGTPDSAGYDAIARNLMEGHGFSSNPAPPYQANHYRTPVYPYFLVAVYAVFGFNHVAVYVIQAVIGSLTCCLIYLICRRYWGERTALLAALLNAVFPFPALFTAVVLTETVYAFLVCCTVYLLTRAYQGRSLYWMAGAGVALGVTALCRPEACLLAPFLVLILLCCCRLRRPAWEMSAVLVVSSGLVLFPWLVRNYYTSGKVMSLVNSGPGAAFWQCTLPYFSMDTFQFDPGAEERDPVVRAYKGMTTDEEWGRMEPVFWRAGWENIRNHPLTYLRLRLRDYPHLWISSGDYFLGKWNCSFSQALAQRQYGLICVKGLLLLVTGVLPLALALLGLVLERHRLGALWPLWMMLAYISLTRLPFDIQPRLSLGGQPFMLVFAAAALAYVWRRSFLSRVPGRSLECSGLQPV